MKLKDLIIRLLAMDQELEVFSYDEEGDDAAVFNHTITTKGRKCYIVGGYPIVGYDRNTILCKG